MKLSGGSYLRREWRYVLVAIGCGLYLGAILTTYVLSKAGGW